MGFLAIALKLSKSAAYTNSATQPFYCLDNTHVSFLQHLTFLRYTSRYEVTVVTIFPLSMRHDAYPSCQHNAGAEGVEPSLTVLETAILPLEDAPITT